MSILQYIVLHVLTLPALVALDLLWLGVIAKQFYFTKLGHLLGPINWPGAIAFYIVYTAGVILFAVSPALQATSLAKAGIYGALFGFFAYATYDLTNYATLKEWPLSVVLVDIVWGAFITSLVAVVSFFLATTFLK